MSEQENPDAMSETESAPPADRCALPMLPPGFGITYVFQDGNGNFLLTPDGDLVAQVRA